MRTITTVATLALLGLMAIQVYLLANAMELKRQAFRQNVFAALSEVSRQLETQETFRKVVAVSMDMQQADSVAFDSLSEAGGAAGKREARKLLIKSPGSDSSRTTHLLRSPGRLVVRMTDSSGKRVEQIVEQIELSNEGAPQHSRATEQANAHYSYNFTADSPSDTLAYVIDFHTDDSTGFKYRFGAPQNKKALVEKVVQQLSQDQRQPVSERIDAALLDSLLAATLAKRDISTPYAYGVVLTAPADSVVLANKPELRAEIAGSGYRAVLFPFDILAQENHLAVYFPQERLYLLKQISASVITSVFFILLLSGCFIYTIRTIAGQKRFADRLTGFINNMVHEFKTPISSIALASESLLKPGAPEQGGKIERYSRIIADENRRMRDQVDKILQMAVLEKGDFALNRSSVDINRLILNAVQKVRLQAEKRNGQIKTRLQAERHIVAGDALHLANIIFNLLDNALKYTRSAPEIEVSTHDYDGFIGIRVCDNGIGLSREDCERVFDKYYRVPTGNVHGRGFKLMVRRSG